MARINAERLIELMARYENGDDMHPSNPFGEPDESLLIESAKIDAFVSVGACTSTLRFCPPDAAEEDIRVAIAITAFIQGAAIGFDYALELHEKTHNKNV